MEAALKFKKFGLWNARIDYKLKSQGSLQKIPGSK